MFFPLINYQLLLSLLATTVYARTISNYNNEECMLNPSGVYVAISSEADFLVDGTLRWIEIYWYGIATQPGDYVGLWDHDPRDNSSNVLETAVAGGVDGGVMLNMQWDGSSFPTTIEPGMQCLPYWAGYVQNNTILYTSCLSVHPNWMEDNRGYISSMRIAELLLPGCHDAGAYGSPDLLINDNGEVGRWTFAQDENLWQQMVLGVRYFDMRVSYYNNTEEKFYVNHGDVRIRPLEHYLNMTSSFVSATKEIVIFDIHRLEFGFGDNEEAKEELQNYIVSWLGDWMAPKVLGPNPTLELLWSQDKRIIATFPEDTTSLLYWNNVYHLWGNVNDLTDLYDYMNTNIPLMSGRGSMWSCMTEFTPSTIDVTLNRWGGLRGAANITNEPVTLWLRREWWQMVNIIAMDFIASSDIVNTVIEGNLMRYACNITIPSALVKYLRKPYSTSWFLGNDEQYNNYNGVK